ncbi:Hypothetical predicted protein, partial [Olea europaea subsp. europaea]
MPGQPAITEGSITLDTSQVTQSVDRLVNHLSIYNVNPPRFDSFKDVHDFLAQFEKLTTALDDSQKLIVLPKAFPVDCYRSWYETELLPLIKTGPTWSRVRNILLARFSSTDEQEKHLVRLRELKFDPDEGKSFLSFVEDTIYSYKRAHPGDSEPNTIKYLKASLPGNVKSKLNLYADFKSATSIAMLKVAAKDYDLANTPGSNAKSPKKDSNQELVKLFTEMMSNLKKENEETRTALVTALQSRENNRPRDDHQPERPSSSSSYYRSDRQKSPNRSNYDRRARSPSPGYKNNRYKRSSSPGDRYESDQDRNQTRSDGDRKDFRPSRSRSPTNYQQDNRTKSTQ